jgi:probable HAF family extracellular repeat protein
VADAINNTGLIAGSCAATTGQAHLVLWHDGTVTDLGTLGTPGTFSFTQAVAINNTGQIAGTVFSGGTTEGFFYSNGTITNLGSFLSSARGGTRHASQTARNHRRHRDAGRRPGVGRVRHLRRALLQRHRRHRR